MSEKKDKKKSYTVLTWIAGIAILTFLFTLGFEVWKPITFNQYPWLSILVKVSLGVALLSLILQLIIAIFVGVQGVKDKRQEIKNGQQTQPQQAYQPQQPQNNNYQPQQPQNNNYQAQQPNNMGMNNYGNQQPVNNNGFQEVASPIHPRVTLQTKYDQMTFIVRIKQKMRLINK